MNNYQIATFTTDQFKSEVTVFFDKKAMPKKENVTLFVYRNMTEKISEYEIEITKFISDEFVE
jgi:hypothetical protein